MGALALFALFIPIATGGILAVFFNRKITWWEYILPMVVTIILIGITRWVTEYSQVADTEYWTGWATKAEYYERWNELKEWDEEVEVGTTKGGKKKTKKVHHKKVIDHPATWNVVDNNGLSVSISSGEFEYLSQKFKSRKFVNMHRNYHTVDGGKYEAVWPGDENTLEVVTTVHTYRNRIQASDSIYKFRKIDKEEKERYGLFFYPKVNGYRCQSILGYDDPTAERKLSLLNAKLGKGKQIRIWVLVFPNQPMDAAISQMNCWEGGNKNELVLTVGIDSDAKIQWAYTFSWTEKEMLKVQTRDLFTEQNKLNLSEVVDKLGPLVEQGWERKHFKDFNYLSVEPPWWSVLIIYVLTFATNVGLAFWFAERKR